MSKSTLPPMEGVVFYRVEGKPQDKRQLDLVEDIRNLFLSQHEDIALDDTEVKAITERIGSEVLDAEHLLMLICLLRSKTDEKTGVYRALAHGDDVEQVQEMVRRRSVELHPYDLEAVKGYREYLKTEHMRNGGKSSNKILRAALSKLMIAWFNGSLVLKTKLGKQLYFRLSGKQPRGFKSAFEREVSNDERFNGVGQKALDNAFKDTWPAMLRAFKEEKYRKQKAQVEQYKSEYELLKKSGLTITLAVGYVEVWDVSGRGKSWIPVLPP